MIEDLRQIWRYRELFYALVVKELKLRYRYTLLGIGWALLSPLLLAVILWFVMTTAFRPDIPDYPLFLLSGLFPWFFFQSALMDSTGAILYSPNLIKHVWFPRILLPLSIVVSKLVHLVIAIGLFVLFRIFTSDQALFPLVWLLPLFLCQALLAFGLASAVSALNCSFRDIRYLLEFFLILLFYGSPILYPFDRVQGLGSPFARYVFFLNPMSGILSAYHSLLAYGEPPPLGLMAPSVLVSGFLFLLGLWVFKRRERFFADLV